MSDPLKEEEIRPQALFAEYMRLAQRDAETYFPQAGRVAIRCPACGGDGGHAFEKNGFGYDECPRCESLYVSPRPAAERFVRYYTDSPSSKFWATTFYRETAGARRERLWKPKAQLVRSLLRAQGFECPTVYDIGGGYGIFAEEMRLLGLPTIVIEPAPHLAAICRENGLSTIEKFLENLDRGDLESSPKAMVSFELFEHLHDPRAFLEKVHALLAPGEIFIFTTLSGTGVDIRALWKDSKSVTPPYHLNFLNPASVRMLVDSVGLQTIEVTTPGKLDIDILENNAASIKDRFWRTFIHMASDRDKAECQAFIARSGWSSHMMVACRKPAL
ncbi:MAG: class I SAM-dependent methyltransferase [Steroidobacteraceae bacterium]